jgi:poly(beta-D-mannuronate) lyase
MKSPHKIPASSCVAQIAATLIAMSSLALAASAATISVNSNSTLASAVSSANPGDTIILADGTYAGFTMSRSGTATAPIVIEAANQGSATISSGIVKLDHVSYVTLQGLTITTPGGALTVDQSTSFLKGQNVSVWLEVAISCRVTRCTFKVGGSAKNQWLCLTDACDSNRIDHNEFGPNSVTGSRYVFPSGNATIPGVTPPSDRTSWADGNGPINPNISRNTQIDHNYFHDQGGAETIVTGGMGVTGDYQNTNTIIEYNLFTNCDGDSEVISNKSSSNIIRYNTFRTCAGMISIRSGNSCSVYGNFLLGGGKTGSGGVEACEMDHVIYNNYIENTTTNYPIMLQGGDAYSSSSFAHAQVVNAIVVNNTVVNPGTDGVLLGHTHPLPPKNCVFANNIIFGGSGKKYAEESGATITRSNNIIFPTSAGLSGFTVIDPKFTTVNGVQKLSSSSPAIDAGDNTYTPLVEDDMDGQPRDAHIDIGADEFSSAPSIRHALTTADVGPLSDLTPQAAAPTFSPAGGTYAGTQTVTITSATSGVSIRYTTDGSTPSETAGTLYLTSPVAISSTTTLKAIAYETGFTDSTVSSATYTITLPQAAAPAFSPGGGTYASAQTVSITSATGGTSIRYTTDGSTPSETAGTIYSGPVSISTTTTLKAIAYEAGLADSPVTSATYTFGPPPTLNFEAESLSPTGTGATVSISNDANASGGVVEFLNSTAAGQIMTFTTPSISAGTTYQVQLRYKTNTTRGQHTVKIDGTQIGGTLDQYATTQAYLTATLGTVTFSTTGPHTIVMTVTGKNSAATQFYITADKFTFVGQ